MADSDEKTLSDPKSDESLDSELNFEDLIANVYKKCILAGFSQSEIYEMAKPLRKVLNREKKQKFKSVTTVLILLFILWSVLKIDWSPIIVSYYGRHALISLMPYWDWTKYYYQTCLIENPHYEPRRLYEDDCEVCESLNKILIKANANHMDITEDYLKNDVPIVLENSLTDWNIESQAFSAFNISKILIDGDPSGDILPCAFTSNLRLRGENYFRVFLTKLQSKIMNEKSWFAHWENCDKTASKALRRKYPRPSFLPPVIDATEPNWVFLSANYQARSFKNVHLISEMMWLAQLEGYNELRLIPRSPCNNTCLQLNHTLKKGETVLFTNRLWQLDYYPGKNDINIAIGGGGSFYDF